MIISVRDSLRRDTQCISSTDTSTAFFSSTFQLKVWTDVIDLSNDSFGRIESDVKQNIAEADKEGKTK